MTAVSTTPSREGSDRNKVVVGVTYGVMAGNALKGFALDRARALVALPHARSQGLGKKWAAEFPLGRFTDDVVPITGGTVSFRGKLLTENGWHHAYRYSNGFGTALIVASMSYGVPNLIDALTDDDDSSLLQSRVGRTGVFGTVANVTGLSVMGAAYVKAGEGAGRIGRTLKHPIHASGPAVAILGALSIPVVVNEFGLLDRFNRSSSTPA
jgi:hypothetical protein